MWYIKVIRGDALKKMHEDKVSNSTPEVLIEEVRSRIVSRGGKAFTTLICQFQSVDEFFSKDIDFENFKIALGYFKCFHLSDTQLKKLFEHFAKNSKTINYVQFTM